MSAHFKKGFSSILLAAISFVLVAIILAIPVKTHVYSAYQHIGMNLGFNFNNISKDSYKKWIESQPGSVTYDVQAVFLNKQIPYTAELADNSFILGENTGPNDNKWIEIDLSEQRLYMKDNGNTINSFLISSGKWAPTPTGEFHIWTKLKYARMTGGSKALGTFYDLPNVPYTMYYNQGYGIHGAYWHNNFGHPMSHGCINVKPQEAAIVYNWASVGTRVVIHS